MCVSACQCLCVGSGIVKHSVLPLNVKDGELLKSYYFTSLSSLRKVWRKQHFEHSVVLLLLFFTLDLILVFQPTEVVRRKTKKSHSMKSKSTGHLLETAHSKYIWVPRSVHMSVFLHLQDRVNPGYRSLSVTSVCNLLFTAVKGVGRHCPPDGLLQAVCCLHA